MQITTIGLDLAKNIFHVHGIPLLVFLAKPCNDNVGFLNQRPRANRVDAGSFIVVREFVRFRSEYRDAANV